MLSLMFPLKVTFNFFIQLFSIFVMAPHATAYVMVLAIPWLLFCGSLYELCFSVHITAQLL
jgi:hypothetical protein